MATSSVQQNKDSSALDLNLSLGGVFWLPKGSCEINEDNPPLDSPSKPAGGRVLPSPSSSPSIPESPHELQFALDHCMKDAHHDPPKRRQAALQSQDIKQQKRARGSSEQELRSSVTTSADSGNISIKASCSGNPEHSFLQLDRDMDMHLIRPRNGVSCGLDIPHKSTPHQQPNQQETSVQFVSSSHSQAISCASCVQCIQASPSNTPSAHSPTGKASDPVSSRLSLHIGTCLSASTDRLLTLEASRPPIINHMQKSRIGDQDEKISYNTSSTELENGDNLEDEGATSQKATELEAPKSRCSSNSDMIGSMGSLTATPTTSCSSMMYMQPSALPVQGPFAMPIQCGLLPLPYPMLYSPHMLPPDRSFPWISCVPDSASCLRSEELAASDEECKLRKNQDTSHKSDIALTRPASPRHVKKVQDVSRKTEVPAAIVHESMPGSASEVYTSSSLKLVCYTSPTANCSSDACTSPWRPLTSATLPAMKDSCDSLIQVNPAGKACRSHAANNSSPTQAICSRSLCPQKSNDSGITINKLCEQSKHTRPPGRKPAKTVRFSSDDLVKSVTDENQTLESSSSLNKSGCKSQSVEKLHTWQEMALRNCAQPNGSILKRRTAQGCQQEEESVISRITSENSDQGDSVPTKVKPAGMLEGQNAVTLPRVSTTCPGPNGRTIHGVMYITKSRQACLICSCHAKHMSPSEFVQHSGSTDLTNPERQIVVTGFSCVKQVGSIGIRIH